MVSVVDIIQRVVLWFPPLVFVIVSVVVGNVCLWFPSLVWLWFPSWQETFVCGFRRWFLGGFCRRRRIHNFRMYRAIPRVVCFQDWCPSLVCVYGFRRGRKTLCMVSVNGLFMVSSVARNVVVWFPSLVVVMVSGCYRNVFIYIYMYIWNIIWRARPGHLQNRRGRARPHATPGGRRRACSISIVLHSTVQYSTV